MSENTPIALVLTLLLAVVTVALTLYVPILIGDAIDCIIGEGNVNFSALKTIFLKIGISVAITAAAQWIMSALNNRITYQVVRDLRSDAFSKISSLPLKYLDSHPHGETVSRIIADADQFADGLLMGFTQFFTGRHDDSRHARVHAGNELENRARRHLRHAAFDVYRKVYFFAYLCVFQKTIGDARGTDRLCGRSHRGAENSSGLFARKGEHGKIRRNQYPPRKELAERLVLFLFGQSRDAVRQ